MKLVCGISSPLILKVQFLFSLLAFLQDFLGSKIQGSNLGSWYFWTVTYLAQCYSFSSHVIVVFLLKASMLSHAIMCRLFEIEYYIVRYQLKRRVANNEWVCSYLCFIIYTFVIDLSLFHLYELRPMIAWLLVNFRVLCFGVTWYYLCTKY